MDMSVVGAIVVVVLVVLCVGAFVFAVRAGSETVFGIEIPNFIKLRFQTKQRRSKGDESKDRAATGGVEGFRNPTVKGSSNVSMIFKVNQWFGGQTEEDTPSEEQPSEDGPE